MRPQQVAQVHQASVSLIDMACECDREAIIAASVELFHATMASMYNGLTVSVSGGDAWWTGTGYTGTRYVATGTQAVYSYSAGQISVQINYSLTAKDSW